MFTVGPAFFGTPGDHPADDGLTALQCIFTGASGADVSGNAVPVTQNGGTLGEGFYETNFALGTATNLGIAWSGAGPLCARTDAAEAYTVEFFFTITRYVQANNDSTKNIVNLDNLTSLMTGFTAPIRWYLRGDGNPLLHTYTGLHYGNPANQVLSVNAMQHVAIVWGTDSYYRVFLNGSLLVGPGLDTSDWLSGTVSVTLGSATLPTYLTDFTARYFGIRIRRAKMYANGGFTPPSSAAVWGPP